MKNISFNAFKIIKDKVLEFAEKVGLDIRDLKRSIRSLENNVILKDSFEEASYGPGLDTPLNFFNEGYNIYLAEASDQAHTVNGLDFSFKTIANYAYHYVDLDSEVVVKNGKMYAIVKKARKYTPGSDWRKLSAAEITASKVTMPQVEIDNFGQITYRDSPDYDMFVKDQMTHTSFGGLTKPDGTYQEGIQVGVLHDKPVYCYIVMSKEYRDEEYVKFSASQNGVAPQKQFKELKALSMFSTTENTYVVLNGLVTSQYTLLNGFTKLARNDTDNVVIFDLVGRVDILKAPRVYSPVLKVEYLQYTPTGKKIGTWMRWPEGPQTKDLILTYGEQYLSHGATEKVHTDVLRKMYAPNVLLGYQMGGSEMIFLDKNLDKTRFTLPEGVRLMDKEWKRQYLDPKWADRIDVLRIERNIELQSMFVDYPYMKYKDKTFYINYDKTFQEGKYSNDAEALGGGEYTAHTGNLTYIGQILKYN